LLPFDTSGTLIHRPVVSASTAPTVSEGVCAPLVVLLYSLNSRYSSVRYLRVPTRVICLLLPSKTHPMAHTIQAVPVELWDLILHHLDGDSLLTLAVVCREFNKLAIQVYLRKHGISATSIQEGDVDISCDVLLALQLSCPPLPLKALRCTFSGSQLSRKLHLLRSVVSQTPGLQELNLEIACYHTPRDEAALHDVLYAACGKLQGPVLVVYADKLLKYTARDVSAWQLPQLSASVGPVLAPRWVHRCLGAIRRVEKGALQFSSVSIRTVPLAAKPLGPCTILVSGTITSLRLGGKGWRQVESLSSAEISAIIPHLTFPHLENLNIETNSIDSVAFGAFLMRHPKITKISYEPRKSTFDFLHWGQIPPLISPPIAHPGLEKIFVRRTADLILLLDGLSALPLLSSLTFPYVRNSTSSVVMLKAILRRIATQPAAALRLHLCIEGRNTPSLDAEEKALARALTTLHHLEIECRSIESARTMFPFLACLPALRCLEFWLMERVFTTDAQIAEFVVEAKAELPGVRELSMDVYENVAFGFST
ncbi:hypothetical protein DFH08DRAFT_1002222, partial [Mycena albidolilacea]